MQTYHHTRQPQFPIPRRVEGLVNFRHYYAWTLGSSILCPLISCLEILMIRHFHVRHFQRPRTATGPPVGPTDAADGSNKAS